jgi:hypothetical protein
MFIIPSKISLSFMSLLQMYLFIAIASTFLNPL